MYVVSMLNVLFCGERAQDALPDTRPSRFEDQNLLTCVL
jgi:hypothetical protein